MEMYAWFVPTLERLVSVMNYPDKANEFASSKVTPAAARQALQLMLNHMGMELPAPRIEPTIDGGLRCEWHEYWVDCVLIVAPNGSPRVELSTNGGVPIDESAWGHDPAERLLERSFRMLGELLRAVSPSSPPPIVQAVPPPSTTKG
jgi:hypothetical protein